MTFMFVVPPSYYYKVPTVTHLSLGSWLEYTINTGSVTQTTPANAVGTTYQNTSGYAKLVCVVLSTSSAAGTQISGISDSAASPTVVVWNSAFYGAAGTYQTMWMLIPNGDYYKVTCTNGTALVWNEWTLPFQATKSADLVAAPIIRKEIGGLAAPLQNAGYWPTASTVFAIFFNNSGKDIFAMASDVCTATTSGLVSAAAPTMMPNTMYTTGVFSSVANYQRALPLFVLPGEFYYFGCDGNTTTCNHWWEYTLG